MQSPKILHLVKLEKLAAYGLQAVGDGILIELNNKDRSLQFLAFWEYLS